MAHWACSRISGSSSFRGILQNRQREQVPGVAERDRNVAQIPASLGAFDGTPLEASIKLLS